MAGDETIKCGFCDKGKKIENICGKLYKLGDGEKKETIAAHKMCMQYSAELYQFQEDFMEFGKFDPEKVKKEIKRGRRLKCTVCKKKPTATKSGVTGATATKSRVTGATAGCAFGGCKKTFHFPCVQDNGYKKRIRKAYNDRIEIEYRVFCSPKHLELIVKEMEKEKEECGYSFTTDTLSDEEENQSEDLRQTSREILGKGALMRKGQSSKEQEKGSPRSAQPEFSQTPSTSKKESKTSKHGNQKQIGKTRPSHTRRKLENASPSQSSNPPRNSVTNTQQPVQAHERRNADLDPASGTNSSDEGNESPLETKKSKKKNKLTKKRAKGTKSSSGPDAKLADDTAVKKSRGTSMLKTPKSSNKSLTRPENQPRITRSLSKDKAVENLNLDDASIDARNGIISSRSRYHTVKKGDREMFHCSVDSQGATMAGSPEAATSETPVEHEEADGQICPVHGLVPKNAVDPVIGTAYITKEVEPAANNQPDGDGNQGSLALKRSGSHLEQPEAKKIKAETGSPSPGISSEKGAEDYILVVTEDLITDTTKGCELALRVRGATGGSVPLNRIIFWRHAVDDSYTKRQMQYRLLFMVDVLEGVKSQKLFDCLFNKPGEDVNTYVDHIDADEANAKYKLDSSALPDQSRKKVRACAETKADSNWKVSVIKPDNKSVKICLLVHVGDDLDPDFLVRQHLQCMGLFKWPKENGQVTRENFVTAEFTRYYSNSILKMYVDVSSLPEWWKDAETKTLYDWIDERTNCKLAIDTKPDDEILKSHQPDSVARQIRERLCKKKKERTNDSNDSESQPVKELAVLVMVPLKKNIIIVAEYMRECIPHFCKKKLTANNAEEGIIVCDTQEMSNGDLAQLVHSLYEALDKYDVSLYTGVEPSKGPISCLCLHVKHLKR